MDVREKLVELLKSVLPNFRNNMAYWGEKPIYEFADCLLANGVTVQECKLGDKKTNADHIRAMNDEELAMCLYEIGYDRGWNALEGTLEWLQQPAEEADNETVEEQKDGDGNG